MTINYDNDYVLESFEQNEFKDLFDELMDMYFRRNFGSTSKADLETFLFSYYLEHLIRNGMPYDDYTLGKDLGLTISRVRSLKERKELKYPHDGYDWRESFLECAKAAKYDEVKHLIKFTIPDVNVMKDVRNYFEKNHYYDEYQLNPKLFQCKLDAFLDVGERIANEKGQKFIIDYDDKKIRKLLENETRTQNEKNGISKILEGAVIDGLKDLAIHGSKALLQECLNYISPGAGVGKLVIKSIIKSLSN